MGRRKWRPCSSFYGHDLEIAHITSSHLPSARNLNHVTLSLQRSLGNGDSSKELRRGVVFLKGRREWTMGDNLLSLHKKMSKGRLLCASAIRLQYTLRKVYKTVNVVCACSHVSAHTEWAECDTKSEFEFVTSPASGWIDNILWAKIKSSVLFMNINIYVFLSTDTWAHVVHAVFDSYILEGVNGGYRLCNTGNESLWFLSLINDNVLK